MRIVNQLTKEVFELSDEPGSRSSYRFRRLCRALDRKAMREGLEIYFVTLTLGPDDAGVRSRELNRILDFLRVRCRRAGSEFLYVWVIELQAKRYHRTGKMVPHWHFAIAVAPGGLPDVEFRAGAGRRYVVKCEGSIVASHELWSEWGYGQVFPCRAKTRVYGYLSKYLGKEQGGVGDARSIWGSARRFGSSRFGRDAYPQWAREKLECLSRMGVPLDRLRVCCTGGRLRLLEREVFWACPHSGREAWRWKAVDACRSPWEVECGSYGFF